MKYKRGYPILIPISNLITPDPIGDLNVQIRVSALTEAFKCWNQCDCTGGCIVMMKWQDMMWHTNPAFSKYHNTIHIHKNFTLSKRIDRYYFIKRTYPANIKPSSIRVSPNLLVTWHRLSVSRSDSKWCGAWHTGPSTGPGQFIFCKVIKTWVWSVLTPTKKTKASIYWCEWELTGHAQIEEVTCKILFDK